jgi:hypothetical protein
MNAPPFPLNPAVGERFGNWVWNGTRWVSTRATGVQVLVSVWNVAGSYPYQPSPGLITVVFEAVGGGGGGGGATTEYTAASTQWISGGGGGASGDYARKAIPAALVLGGVVVTVGAGGLPGTPTGFGGQGGTTSFGAFCSAVGGAGGQYSNIAVPAASSSGLGRGGARNVPPTGSIGDFVTSGTAGEGGTAVAIVPDIDNGFTEGGKGGVSVFGGAAQAVYCFGGETGAAGGGGFTGSGGGGGAVGLASLPTGGVIGGVGGDGVAIATEYCWGDAGDVTCLDPNRLDVNARVTVERDWGRPGPHPRPPQNGPPAGFLDDLGPYGETE